MLACCICPKLDLLFLKVIQENVVCNLVFIKPDLLWLLSDDAIVVHLLILEVGDIQEVMVVATNGAIYLILLLRCHIIFAVEI